MKLNLKNIAIRGLILGIEKGRNLKRPLCFIGRKLILALSLLYRLLLKPILVFAYQWLIKARLIFNKSPLKERNVVTLSLTKRSIVHGIVIFIALIPITQILFSKENTALAKPGLEQGKLLFALLPAPYEEETSSVLFLQNSSGEDTPLEELLAMPIEPTGAPFEEEETLTPAPFITTTIGQPRKEIIAYQVEAGDTVSTIAEKFGISLNTILWENKLSLRSTIREGQTLRILPTTGVSYKVKKNDTLQKIARTYGGEVEKIKDFNQLRNNELALNTTLIIPGGKMPYVAAYRSTISSASPTLTIKSGEAMFWPSVSRRITQYFSWRHPGLDIASGAGTTHFAVLPGKVIFSGRNGAYGLSILVDHGGGLVTRYAHHSKLLVSAGDYVEKGQKIALEGSTGRSTGPHLHLEVIVKGVRVNPFYYLK
jgi:murein DD-endopeptidase MepM/ murein hydrolase activator NlpD